jgi:polyisoprenoid-binding protein YceI
MPRRRRHYLRWVILGLAILIVLGVGGPLVYIHLIEGPAPAPLALPKTNAAPRKATSTTFDGTWTVGKGSVAGYRVQEVLVGQNTTAVGRTTSVTGSIVIANGEVSSGSFTVDLATVKSNEGARDVQFRGRIMDTSMYPDAIFTLTKAIDLGPSPELNKTFTASATGSLTMHGVTRSVRFSVSARDSGSLFEVVGSIPVVFANWNIANPSFAGFVTVENHGLVEFSLDLRR